MNKLAPKILFIEDDDAFFNMLKNRLTKRNYSILRSKNGKDGIEKAKRYKPDLVVTDIVIPEANGFEIIREIRGSMPTSKIKIIILSDYGETRLVYKKDFLNSLGITKYLIKSNHNPTEILAEIEKIFKT